MEPPKNRNSHRRCFARKGVLRNSAKFSRKHLCQNLFFNKVADLRPVTLFKKRLWQRCFHVNFTKFLRTSFLQNTSGGYFCKNPRLIIFSVHLLCSRMNLSLFFSQNFSNSNSHCVKSIQIRNYFCSVFSCIRPEYGNLLRKSPYSVLILKNMDQK